MSRLAIRKPSNADFAARDLRPWNQSFGSLFDEMEKVFSPFRSSTEGSELSLLHTDIHETDGSYILSLDIPGVKLEDIKLEFANNLLTIATDRRSEAIVEGIKTHLVERQFGTMKRTFSLPKGIDSDAISANYENGVLFVSIPKEEVSKPKKIQVGEGKAGFFTKVSAPRAK